MSLSLLVLCLLNQTPITDFHKENPNGDLRPLTENKTVIADKGTNVREQASTKSAVIGQLKFGDEVVVVGYTKKKLSLEEAGVNLTGSWVKINAHVLLRDPTTQKYLRDDEGRLKRVVKNGFVFNGFLASDAFRPPNPRLLCAQHCKQVDVRFANAKDFKEGLSKNTKLIPDAARQVQNSDESITVVLENKKKRTLTAPKALKKIDGGAALLPGGFIGDVPLLQWSGHMGDGFVVLNPSTGKIERIIEGQFLALSKSGNAIAYYTTNGESDATEFTVHFGGRLKSLGLGNQAWCQSGQAFFEDDKTLLVEVMRGNDCSNPEFDNKRKKLQVPLRIRYRR